jgi:hypothetical protein
MKAHATVQLFHGENKVSVHGFLQEGDNFDICGIVYMVTHDNSPNKIFRQHDISPK